MGILADKYKSYINRPGPFSAALHIVKGFIRRLVGFFILTEEERLKAGIYKSGQDRDG